MSLVAIIQARMGSTRLPGKTLMDLEGKPILQWMLDRVDQATHPEQVVVATSDSSLDNPIQAFCDRLGIPCFRGDEMDVLSRFHACADKFGATEVIRLTADCPLIDPEVIDLVVEAFKANDCDYAANTLPLETSTFPDGCDVEILSLEALQRSHQEATELYDREHVTPFIRDPKNDFILHQVRWKENWSDYRYTLDSNEDFTRLEQIARWMQSEERRGTMTEIVEFLRSPENCAA